jgi:hypothetical protein
MHAALPFGTTEPIRNSHRPASNFGTGGRNTKKTRNRESNPIKSSREIAHMQVGQFLLPREPFTAKIREILVRTQRSPRNAFGAARQTMPFDRVDGDKTICGLRLFAFYVRQHANAKFATHRFVSSMELWPCLC